MYKLVSKKYVAYVNSLTYGVKMPRADPNTLLNIKQSIPPFEVQQKVAQYLNKATSKIDKTIKLIEQKINLLEEYKKSLIHYVVTGKVDVRKSEV
jgi:type I restriction enzyme S subunit